MRHSERWVLTSMGLGVRPCVFFSSVRAFSCCLYVRCSFVISLFTAVIFLHSYLHDFSFCFVCGISCWMTVYVSWFISWSIEETISSYLFLKSTAIVYLWSDSAFQISWTNLQLQWSLLNVLKVFGEFSLDRLHRDCSASFSSRSSWHRSFPSYF